MNWLRKILLGRYGGDQLGMALIVCSMALTVITMFIPVPIIGYVGLIPLAFAFYRMFSKNIAKRQAENYRYLKMWYGIKNWFSTLPARMRASKNHRFYRCPKCGQKVRVPKGKGKISITCPKCREKFIKNTGK